MGALCVGILVPYNDPTLLKVLNTQGDGTGAASPYVIAMQNLGVSGLPHLVNALLVTSIFSAGNTYCYMATRSLYSLSLSGQAPKFLQTTNKSGIPYYCFAVTMAFPFLSFLQVSNGSATAITWLVNLVTASQLINYVVMGTTYLFFYRACKAQGIDRNTLPYRGTLQNPALPLLLTDVRLVPTISHLYWSSFRHYYRMCPRLRCLPPRRLGRRIIPHLLPDDLRLYIPLLRLEIP